MASVGPAAGRAKPAVVGTLSFAGAALAGFAVALLAGVALGRATGLRPLPGTRIWNWTAPTRSFATGANILNITNYGFGDATLSGTTEDTEVDLAELKRIGATVVRVIPAYGGISADEAARRLDVFLTRAARYNISVLVSLTNYYGDSRQYPQGTDRYYTEYWRGVPYLNHEFFVGGYRAEYRDFVRAVIVRNRQHPNIYAWEPGNELQDSDPLAFIAFMRDVTDYIKELDPAHPVADGLIEAHQVGLTPEQLYPNLPSLDIVTVHPGNGYRASAIDVDWALRHNKKAIVEETGFSSTEDRTERFRREIQFWRLKGVSAFLMDGFIAKGLPDNGAGDRQLGFDDIWHVDYDGLAALLRSVS